MACRSLGKDIVCFKKLTGLPILKKYTGPQILNKYAGAVFHHKDDINVESHHIYIQLNMK